MILIGDCRDVLPTLPAQSVQTCVTSPPYFGLRDYGTATWDGGDPACDHDTSRWDGPKQTQGAQSGHASKADRLSRQQCHRCGATRVDTQIGLEPTVTEYVAQLVAVFREVRRVLADDGTLWLNLGDSYNAGRDGGHPGGKQQWKPEQGKYSGRSGANVPGLKPKDLIGVPWRVAFALQDDGWWLRKDNIWHKPNPMPESVTDRTTTAHEYMFHFSKSARYYYDAAAIAEPITESSIERLSQPNLLNQNGSNRQPGKVNGNMKAVGPRFGGNKYGDNPDHPTKSGNIYEPNGKRNKRSVWTISTRSFKDAHFATFPPKLVEPCILAGSRPGDTVLDPFGGSGTTGEVATALGRKSILIELNPDYLPMIEKRMAQQGLL